MYFYSPSTNGVYIKTLNSKMPADVREISLQMYQELFTQAGGGVVIAGVDGLPVRVEAPAASADRVVASERAWRDLQLLNTEWLRDRHRDEQDIGRDTTLTAEQFVQLIGYLQALREWPQSDLFPDIEHRPIAPGWIAQHTQ